jgi:hypothetical protein
MSKSNQKIAAPNATAEGVRLVKAFLRIGDPRQRAWLIEQAEALAAR